MPRSPQGHPVLIQAGQSGRGQAFAARWGELIFVVYPNLAAGQKQYAEFKAAVAAAGRDPDEVRIAPPCYVVVGESADADRPEEVDSSTALAKPIDGPELISEVLNYDFGTKRHGRALHRRGTGRHVVARLPRPRGLAVGQEEPDGARLRRVLRARHDQRSTTLFVGTPKIVADQMEEWFTERRAATASCSSPTHMPGSYEDFVRMVVPELQKRGLVRTEYESTTLRGNLGLNHPLAGDWKTESGPQSKAAANKGV